ncbi:3'-5' exonuclease [Maribacter sp. PR1]|uniref:3'-5' exonuclease n=1 Tax=Maribacter cobaltidurans TaxID=1178778 RepID=A0ABU7IVC3_9FLAO|nr:MULTISPECIES: 3'-5' exonuclease [Maribacter]MDC6389441.1 3'-5' exonuclease [Maribacter sp. PR1]MEE1976830.1 3'-5' exonuclease [Maribacter cobaltidurans]
MDFLIIIIAIVFIIVGFSRMKKSNKNTSTANSEKKQVVTKTIKKEVALQPVKNKSTFKPTALILDTETTGLINDNSIRVTKQNVIDHSDNFPRIVQLAFMLVDINGNYDGETFYIKQKERIPKLAIKIHGITNEKCETEGVELEKALLALTVASSKVDDIVGHNIAFDYKVLHAEFVKAGIPFLLKKKNKVDTMKLTGKQLGHKYGFKISLYNSADKLFGNKKEWQALKPNLKEHNAESDIIVTALIYNMLNGK